MASTYSSDLKLELQATGENAGTWGTKTNTNLQLVQQAIVGYEAIDVASADVALVMSNAAISNARNMVLKFTGTLAANRTVTLPDSIEKFYVIVDGTTHSGNTLTFKTVGGTGFTTVEGKTHFCYSDGTNVNEVAGGQIADITLDNVLSNGASSSTTMNISNINVSANVTADTIFVGDSITTSTLTADDNIVSTEGNITATAGTLNDSKGEIRTVILNSKSAAYTLAATDAGKVISITTGGVTVPNSVFSAGETVTIYNKSGSNQTITQGSSLTMYWSQTGGTGNRTLAQRGVATVLFISGSEAVITGGTLT